MKYNFYYDESEHSRSIGFKTVTAENFYDNFITVIVGWKSQNEQKIQEQYCDFEQKYIDRHPDKELKNKTIQPKQLRYGFASAAKGNIAFFDDFLKLFSNDVYIYISTFSKVEYIVNQTSVYKGYKQDKIEMRGDRAEMSDFPRYLNTVAGGLDCRDQTIGGFSFVVKIYAVPVIEIIG